MTVDLDPAESHFHPCCKKLDERSETLQSKRYSPACVPSRMIHLSMCMLPKIHVCSGESGTYPPIKKSLKNYLCHISNPVKMSFNPRFHPSCLLHRPPVWLHHILSIKTRFCHIITPKNSSYPVCPSYTKILAPSYFRKQKSLPWLICDRPKVPDTWREAFPLAFQNVQYRR